MTYQPKVYREQGGNKQVAASGGEIEVQSGAELDVQPGATVKLLDTEALAATTAEINRACDVSARVVTVTAATLAATIAAHDGKTVVLDRAAGITVTLPAATGSGARFRFYNKTTVTSNNHVIQVTGDDTMKGTAWMANDTDATVSAFETASDSDTITMNGSTKGGLVGDIIIVEDVAADVWSVQCYLQGTGTEATPFSAAV